jgi:hypothetical protein
MAGDCVNHRREPFRSGCMPRHLGRREQSCLMVQVVQRPVQVLVLPNINYLSYYYFLSNYFSLTISFVRLFISLAFASSQINTPNSARKIPSPIGPDQNKTNHKFSIFPPLVLLAIILSHLLTSRYWPGAVIRYRVTSDSGCEISRCCNAGTSSFFSNRSLGIVGNGYRSEDGIIALFVILCNLTGLDIPARRS